MQKNSFLPILIAASVILSPLAGQAGFVGIKGADNGPSSNSAEVDFDLGTRDFDAKASRKTDTFFDFFAKLKSSNSQVSDSSGTTISDTSTEGDLYGTWSFPSAMKAGVGLLTSSESADRISGLGLSTLLGYRWNFDSEDEDFNPSIGSKISLGTNHLQQKRAGKKTALALDLVQTSVRLDLDADIVSWFSVFGSYEKFQYSRDINAILLALDHQPVTNIAGAAFSNTLSNFQYYTSSAGIVIHIGDFDMELANSLGKQIANDSDYVDQSLTGSYYGKKWAGSLGAGRSKSGTSDFSNYSSAMVRYLF